jgi:AraC family transcriptional regulator, transcriptional activator of the genes for pyochelin and ferripyochelin receptors
MRGEEGHHRTRSRQRVHLRPGLDLHVADFQPQEGLRMDFESHSVSVRFTFFRQGKGQMDWRVSSGTAVTQKVRPIERSSSISFHPELAGTVCFPAGQRQSHFTIEISQALLSRLLGGRFQRIPHDLVAIFEGCNTIDYNHYGPLSPVMEATIVKLLRCPYSGTLGLMYQESKVIELIAHKLAQIEASAPPSKARLKLRSEDVARVRLAKQILTEDLENPPRLFDLARTVGTSHSRLNIGFRQIYGTSVFGYLRRLRLEEARNLLEKGGLNVTEAAMSVGYNSISSFSRAFATHFGTNPKRFRQN